MYSVVLQALRDAPSVKIRLIVRHVMMATLKKVQITIKDVVTLKIVRYVMMMEKLAMIAMQNSIYSMMTRKIKPSVPILVQLNYIKMIVVR